MFLLLVTSILYRLTDFMMANRKKLLTRENMDTNCSTPQTSLEHISCEHFCKIFFFLFHISLAKFFMRFWKEETRINCQTARFLLEDCQHFHLLHKFILTGHGVYKEAILVFSFSFSFKMSNAQRTWQKHLQ